MRERESEETGLLARSKHGDKAAFGQIVQRYMQRAYFVAVRMTGNHEVALDLSQDAFVRAFRAMKTFDVNKRFFTWYYRILRNLCFNYLRDHAHQARLFSEIGDEVIHSIPDASKNAAELAEQNDLRERLWAALQALPQAEREIIVLRDFEDWSYKEIAEALHCPLGTVMSRLYYARKALREKLQKELA